MTTINIRVDEKLKKQAMKTFAGIGLDLSSAVKMFLTQAVEEKGMPFRSVKRTPKEIRAEWDRGVEEALKYGKRYTSVDELMKDLMR